MVSKELSEAAVEFNCILDNSSQEILDKIPKKFIEFLKSVASTTYKFQYDSKKNLNEQNIKPETRGLISLVYQDYICDEKDKKEYIIKCKDYYAKKEKEMQEKYNLDNIFKNKELSIKQENVALIEVKEEKWYKKVLEIFSRIFKK
ncbi:MAG: hypothetical protein IKD77_05380 [Bacilli bacterium]|nr:hypothetical protein [Bacilli bacterium]